MVFNLFLILIFAGDEDKYAMLDTRPPTASMGGYGLPPPSRAESSFKHYPEDMDNGPEVINVTANATTTLLPGMYKDHIFWEGHKILRNLHFRFDWQYIGQMVEISQNFATFSEYMNFNKFELKFT